MSGLQSPQAAAMDADAFLQKPLDEQALPQTMDRLISTRARQHELARAGELERLVSLGALLGGIAHEINNPLAIALGGIEVARAKLSRLAEKLSTEDAAALAAPLRALDSAHDGAQRVNAVVRSASVFASADLEQIDQIDVREVLESSLQIVSNEIRHAAHIVRELSEVHPVRGNPARLGQVFLNLLLNAIAAIRASGEREHILRVGLHQSGDQVVVSVSDTAACLLEDPNGSLFDPLRTSDRPGSRLRFGLAVSHELVQDMGGRIEGERNLPQGVTYRVWLPVHRAQPGRADASSLPSDPLQSRRVLIIDDEPLMCSLLRTLLCDEYEVTTFTSAREGLADLLQHDYGAILCDMMMPELSGDELFEQAVRVRPALRERFVFITGGAFTRQAQHFLKQAGRPVLAKPCSRTDLLKMLAVVSGAQANGRSSTV
jgi:signal transduction histidine kinase/CheY-like chemotaxis protein